MSDWENSAGANLVGPRDEATVLGPGKIIEGFHCDDYDAIADLFRDLRTSGEVDADPSGWLDTYAESAPYFVHPQLQTNEISRYCIDEGASLGESKSKIVRAISRWELSTIDAAEVTLFHSVSAASLAVLVAMKARKVEVIIFETPAYAVTIKQANELGFSTVLVPTYLRNNFKVDWSTFETNKYSPCAIWMTQPRVSLGYNQEQKEVTALQARLSSGDFLIIDEATEQSFPSHLMSLSNDRRFNTLRLRGFLKGAGLNGVRLAFVLHHKELRSDLETAQEVAGNSLEAFSLRAACEIADRDKLLPEMLAAARRQTAVLRMKVQKLAYGSRVMIGNLVNGYIGCAFIQLGASLEDYAAKRTQLLHFCKGRSMPVLLGANMTFALDYEWEPVRLNYFNQPRHIIKGVLNLIEFTQML